MDGTTQYRDGPALPDVLIEESPGNLEGEAMRDLIAALGSVGIVGEPISHQGYRDKDMWELRLHWLGLETDAMGVGRALGVTGTWAALYFGVDGSKGPRAIRIFGSRVTELGTLALQDEMPA